MIITEPQDLNNNTTHGHNESHDIIRSREGVHIEDDLFGRRDQIYAIANRRRRRIEDSETYNAGRNRGHGTRPTMNYNLEWSRIRSDSRISEDRQAEANQYISMHLRYLIIFTKDDFHQNDRMGRPLYHDCAMDETKRNKIIDKCYHTVLGRFDLLF